MRWINSHNGIKLFCLFFFLILISSCYRIGLVKTSKLNRLNEEGLKVGVWCESASNNSIVDSNSIIVVNYSNGLRNGRATIYTELGERTTLFIRTD